MGKPDTIFSGIKQSIFYGNAGKAQNAENAAMAQKQLQVEKRTNAADRIIHIFELSNEKPTDFAARMGISYKAFNEGIRRRGFPLHAVISLAESLNVTLDYLCGLTDKPAPLRRSKYTRDYWDIMEEMPPD